jgi:hypothetical protein
MLLPKFTTASSLIALLLTTGVTSSPSGIILKNTLKCVHDVLPPHATCVDQSLIHRYLNTISTTIDRLVVDIQIAVYNAGCPDMGQAEAEAVWAVEQCSHHLGDDDLRKVKRQAGKPAETTEAAATTAKGGPKTTLVAATTEPEAPTTEAKPTTATVAPTTSAQVETVTATTQPTTTAAPTSTTGTLPAKPSTCFTTSMVDITTCPIISTGASSGKKGSCYPTSVPTSVCAPGLICRSDQQGNPSCMYADTKFSTAGVIIALFFAVTVTATACLLIFFSCKEKKKNKALIRMREAEAIALEAKKANMKVTVREMDGPGEDGRPLMDRGYPGQDPFRG